VYRHVLSTGNQPKLKVLRYSSSPIISIDSSSKEIIVSTTDSNCIESSNTRAYASRKVNALMTTATLVLTFGHGSSSFLSTGAALLLGTSLFFIQGLSSSGVWAEAAELSCIPAMEIVIEAPPYYLGSVAECLAEVENPDHCPNDFPTFPTSCTDHNPTCELAVVGAGTGGLYTALRLVDENKVDGRGVCIFEATERVGGRLYSLRGFGPSNKITVDAGGYRTWPQYTVRYKLCIYPFSSHYYLHMPGTHNSVLSYTYSTFFIISLLLMH